MSPKSFVLDIPDASIADLRARLARTRYPDEPPLAPWSTGTSLAYLKPLLDYWRDGFDWRAWEAKLNGFRQFTLRVGDIDVHFIHEPSRKPNAMPLLLSHGWPGSVFEFHEIIPLLTEHFTVVAPSLPGYTLSFRPGQPRFGVIEIAEHLRRTDERARLYALRRAGRRLGQLHHLGARAIAFPSGSPASTSICLPVRRDPAMLPNPNAEEQAYLKQLNNFLKEETGYQWIQGTKPQTLAFALTDSPAGLAAWIVEKFRAWTDNNGSPEDAVSRDEMLANIALYWFTGAIGSSFWPYYARMHGPWPIPDGATIKVPMGYAEFPKEILSPPRSLAQRTYTRHPPLDPMPKGGHFAALEQPEALAREVIAFFQELQ